MSRAPHCHRIFMGALVVFVTVGCKQLVGVTECLSQADCSGGGICVDGTCEGGSDPDQNELNETDSDTQDSGTEWETNPDSETSTKRCIFLPVDAEFSSADEECCSGSGVMQECWTQDAESDGIACTWDSDCLSGTCDKTRGVCACSRQEDCNDGEAVQGYCNLERGYCGPSSCNGYFVCSCFGGCMRVTFPYELSQGERCCEGVYSLSPADRPGDKR